ncbi:type I restriction endonuclease [Anaerovorax sp. IOR16]|uniref:type I restriction endonuclease n=1 Tax=Anaerovorax sp. IOR16 TaxID=2773458 RepID=UPI0019D22EF5|nr:type I restriction endonuclease [Anaerovorax sp. IOR16]
MELNEKINQFTQRIESLKDSIPTEEATKTSLIMPFFQMLGYDVFNPLEFVPEFTADVGIKKGEKVDYAIMIDQKPLILIECKPCNENLDKHGSQLFRYFGTTSSKFAILTNGIVYRFYTDLEDKNKMDSKLFLSVDLLNLKDRDIAEISRFVKGNLDVDNILNSASDLKYSQLIKDWFAKEIENPSSEFVKYVLNDVYEGVKSQKIIEKFSPLVKRSISQYINDLMNNKIKSALNKEAAEEAALSNNDETCKVDELEDEPVNKINTTIEELEAYAIIKSILRTTVESTRIVYRDTESYFGILLDDNNRKWICRVHLTSSIKFITIADENKKPIRYNIDTIDDIYQYSKEIIESCTRYL